ncbi:MAG: hypothetical protein R6U08_06805 [Bacillota bacterium]
MDEDKEQKNLDGVKTPSKQEIGGSPQRKKGNALIILLIAVIVLLAVAIILFFTPVGEMVFSKSTTPDISLEVISGPELGSTDLGEGKYRFEVKAIISGNPAPEVTFNRDDSIGEAGENRVLIFLEPGESFTLTAVASNSQGRAEDSLELIANEPAGESEEEPEVEEEVEEEEEEEEEETPETVNHAPIIDGINLPENIFCEEVYIVSAEVNDPDGDSITYNWEVVGSGDTSIDNPDANPMEWTAPAAQGDYTLKLTARDDRGGESVHSQTVDVFPVVTLVPRSSETGFIIKDQNARSNAVVYAGDSSTNKMCRGFISFDISSLADATVHSVELCLPGAMVIHGDPSFMHGSLGLWIAVASWGSRPLELDDYNLVGKGINSYTSYDSYYCEDDNKLIGELQRHIDDGSERFQIRLHFAKEGTDNDGSFDGVEYNPPDISLRVFYEF